MRSSGETRTDCTNQGHLSLVRHPYTIITCPFSTALSLLSLPPPPHHKCINLCVCVYVCGETKHKWSTCKFDNTPSMGYTGFPRNFHNHSLISAYIVKSTILMSFYNLLFYGKNIQNLRALLIWMMMDASFTLMEKLSQSIVITHSCFMFYWCKFYILWNLVH